MRRWLSFTLTVLAGCLHSGNGKQWVEEPLAESSVGEAELGPGASQGAPVRRASSKTLGQAGGPIKEAKLRPSGRELGLFRNTYYDFPSERDFKGATVPLVTSACKPLATVPRAFFEALCVQGSGKLLGGGTVSFAKRDCACAESCPRTGQKICFEALDPSRYPWGRGASGAAITPLVSVAADSNLLPMGTPIYVAEFDGVVVEEGTPPHDGCFRVEDRGTGVVGEHLDVFAGTTASRRELERLVPSNGGVTVLVDVARCERLRRSR